MTGLVTVPFGRVGPVDVPQLYLGDHGFLAKLESSMTEDQVIASMTRMLLKAQVGLAAGDRRVVDAVLAARQRLDRDASLMIHGDLRVLHSKTKIRYRYCAATTLAALNQFGLNLRADPVLNFLYPVASVAGPLPHDFTRGLTLDRESLQELCDDVLRTHPSLVTVGGDWLDMLLLLGRVDLAVEGFRLVADHARHVGSAIVLTTYVGALVSAGDLRELSGLADGVMVTINHSGFGMLPNPLTHLAWVKDLGLPVVGMHLLAGNHDAADALSWLDQPLVATVVIGASSAAHQDTLAHAAAARFDRQKP